MQNDLMESKIQMLEEMYNQKRRENLELREKNRLQQQHIDNLEAIISSIKSSRSYRLAGKMTGISSKFKK